MTTLPKLPEPEIVGVAGFCDDGIGYTEAQMLAFQAATVEACAAVCEEGKKKIWEYHLPELKNVAGNVCTNLASIIRAMLKEKT
jgi:hypothetical protein